MSVNFPTSTPNNLLSAFKKTIDDKRVVTWSYDSAGDFTHAVEQWKNKAWFRPEVKSGQLIFWIIRPQGLKVSSEVYAIYHGRMIESMLAHFDKDFTSGVASAQPNGSDLV